MYLGTALRAGGGVAEPTGFARVLYHKWYVDELYDRIIVRPFTRLWRGCWRVVDDGLIDGSVLTDSRGRRDWSAGWEASSRPVAVAPYALFFMLGAIVIIGSGAVGEPEGRARGTDGMRPIRQSLDSDAASWRSASGRCGLLVLSARIGRVKTWPSRSALLAFLLSLPLFWTFHPGAAEIPERSVAAVDRDLGDSLCHRASTASLS